MVTDDADQHGEVSRGEKRSFDLLARLFHGYGDEETRAIRGKEEQEGNIFMINTMINEGTKALKRKRKIEEYESQVSSKRHEASSPYLSLVESKSHRVVSNEPIKAQPTREIKPLAGRKRVVRTKTVSTKMVRTKTVKTKPVRGERGVTPEWLVNLMIKENGVDAKLVIEKQLKASDLKREQGRLLLPFKQITEMDFLNEAELNIIEEHRNRDRNKGLDVILVDSRGINMKLNLRRWDMNSSSNYALVSGWNEVVLRNKLEEGKKVRLWSFHSHDRLYLALPPKPPTPAMAQVTAAVPAPGPAIALDRDMAQAPAMAQAQVPVPASGSSSTSAPVVTRDSDDYLGQSILEGLDLNRPLAQAPAIAQAQAPVPATCSSSTSALVVTRDSDDDLGRSILEDFDLNRTLDEVCMEMAPFDQAVHDTSRWTSVLTDADLRAAEILLMLRN